MNIKNTQSDITPVRSDNDVTLPEINLASSDCPTVPELNLFATGDLPGIDFEKLARHIESCNICLNKLESSLFDNEKDEFLKHIKPIDENFISELQTPSETLQKALALSGRGDPAHHIEKYRPLFAKPSFEGDLGTFGKFRIIAEIGYGGMGMVFDAYDTLAHRRIALKTLRPDLLGNQTLRALFLDEARMAAKLVHPNIVLLLDVDTIEGVPYITMPLLKGESLQEFLSTNPGGVGLPLFLHIARQLLSGLEHLHLKGLVHRDIKPSNIFLETGLDGKRIVSGSWGRIVKVWDTASGLELLSLSGHSDEILYACFSPDGKKIASSGGGDSTVRIWDASNTMELSILGHREWLRNVAISPDGKFIFSEDDQGNKKFWKTENGKELPFSEAIKIKEQFANNSTVSQDNEWSVEIQGTEARLVSNKLRQERIARDKENLARWATPNPNWHLAQAIESEKNNQWFAATFHLKKLLEFESYKEDATKRLASIEKKAKAN